MTRKDYQLLADAIRENVRPAGQASPAVRRAVQETARSVAAALHRDNARFDSRRFFIACGLADSLRPTDGE